MGPPLCPLRRMYYAVAIVMMVCLLPLSLADETDDRSEVEKLDDRAIPEQMAVLSERIYLKVAKGNEDNFVFSPLSLHSVMTLLFMGSSEESRTNNEIGQLLSTTINLNNGLLPFYRKLLDTYENSNFVYANRVLVNEELTLKPKFLSRSQNLDANILEVDFTANTTVPDVNNWVSNVTAGKINNLVSQLDPATKMLMLNAIYLKENWTIPFSELRKPVPFYKLDGSTVDVDMMERTDEQFQYGRFKYGSEQHPHEFIIIPYESSDFEMQIILPSGRTNFGIRDIEKTLEYTEERQCHLIHNINQCDSQYIKLFIDAKKNATPLRKSMRLTMPIFRVESSINAGDVFKQLGATSMFSERGALREISESPDLRVTNILQKAFIAVNSEGTEAAAATFIEIATFSADPSDLRHVTIDRPFIFMIYDKINEIPIVVGRVMDPKQ